ncbi:hypothetical protein ACM44_02400 [Chryseobacterium koreense CCUG 49689]|uniref:Bacteriophage spanin2 family protein n=2 Tax=Chryseobacterium koreense TaxID=232216 RepID=A0A0J7LTQ2_9FLAO|nr:hypothetical protein ACM44_02400 [Chryseobacterium koreense CCUG 49689]
MVNCPGFELESFLKAFKIAFKTINFIKFDKIILKMKKLRSIIALSLLVFAASCQTRVVDKLKPMQKNSLELYQKYTITTNEPKVVKMEVLKVDDDKIYGKTNDGQEVNINKSDVRTIKKTDWISSILIGAAGILAVIFVPI